MGVKLVTEQKPVQLPASRFASPGVSVARGHGPVLGGDWNLHSFGQVHLDAILQRWLHATKADTSTKADQHMRFLFIVTDSCFGGRWVERLKEIHAAGLLPANRHVVIQSACGPNEKAYSGVFSSIFLRLQNPEWRKFMIAAFRLLISESPSAARELVAAAGATPRPCAFSTMRDMQAAIESADTMTDTSRWLQPEPPGHEPLQLLGEHWFAFYLFCLRSTANRMGLPRVILESEVPGILAALANSAPHFLAVKLKQYPANAQSRSPFALIFLQHPLRANHRLCAHVHFSQHSLKQAIGINLFDHVLRDADGCSPEDDEANHGINRRRCGYLNPDPQSPDQPAWKISEMATGVPTAGECPLIAAFYGNKLAKAQQAYEAIHFVAKFLKHFREWQEHCAVEFQAKQALIDAQAGGGDVAAAQAAVTALPLPCHHPDVLKRLQSAAWPEYVKNANTVPTAMAALWTDQRDDEIVYRETQDSSGNVVRLPSAAMQCI